MGKIFRKWTPILVCILLSFTSCETELEKYYATPDWLKGNSWEVLEKKGDFKLFLAAVEKSSFKDLVQGKGLVTVMAPTDLAFREYLKAHNYDTTTVNDIPASQIDKLVGFHLLFYSFNKETFENYKPDGIESTNLLAGMYYKFRTKSREPISVELDPTTGKYHKVIHNDRFLPVFSYNFFNSLKIDAKTNYEFFYPNSTWTGANGFNISNASVKEYGIVSDNGYVYTIDKVLDPLETIYTNLKNDDNYSQFTNAYERFAAYQYDAIATADYGKGDSLYVKNYSVVLPPIASEWPVSSYRSLAELSSSGYNVIAPDNLAMQAFYEKYWQKPYKDKGLDSVNFEPLLALLDNHVFSSTVLFPEQFEAGIIKLSTGSGISFNRSEVQKKNICVNGSVYGLNKIVVPPMFEKVTAPMYCDPSYNMILNIMKNSGYIPTLTSDAIKFEIFYPLDSMIVKNSNLDGKAISYLNTNSKQYGAQAVTIEGDAGPTNMSVSQKKKFAGAHITTGIIASRGSETIYRTMLPFNYIYTKDDSVYSSTLLNLKMAAAAAVAAAKTASEVSAAATAVASAASKTPKFSIIGDWSNGRAYALLGETAMALTPEYNQFRALTTTTAPKNISTFISYAGVAGLTNLIPPYSSFMQGERFILLVPPTASLLAGYNALPKPTGSSRPTVDQVAAFLKSYFINVSSSNLLDYPFPGANVQGTLVSFGKKSDGKTPVTFTLVDRGTELVIIDAKGKEIKVTSYLPYIYDDGAVYQIDNLLSVE